MRYIEWMIGLSGLSAVAFSTAAAAQDQCSAILQFGIWDTLQSSGNTAQNSAFRNYACSLNKQVRSNSLGVNAFNYGSANIKTGDDLLTQACQDNSGSSSSASAFSDFARTASAIVVEEWGKCMNREGSHATIIYHTQGGRLNQVTAKVQSTTDRGPPIKCNGKNFSTEQKFEVSPQLVIPCSRNSRQDVSMTVNFVDHPGGGTFAWASHTAAVLRRLEAPVAAAERELAAVTKTAFVGLLDASIQERIDCAERFVAAKGRAANHNAVTVEMQNAQRDYDNAMQGVNVALRAGVQSPATSFPYKTPALGPDVERTFWKRKQASSVKLGDQVINADWLARERAKWAADQKANTKAAAWKDDEPARRNAASQALVDAFSERERAKAAEIAARKLRLPDASPA